MRLIKITLTSLKCIVSFKIDNVSSLTVKKENKREVDKNIH